MESKLYEINKTAYMVVTDLHSSYKNKENRFSYLKEIEDVITKTIGIGIRYKEQGYRVILIFLGDIADRSFKEMDKGIWLNNIFVRYRMIFDNIYSVLGNHETTFYKDNPFWTLMNKIDSTELHTNLNHAWKPKGLLQLVNIPDRLVDGEVVFNFNHHATKVLEPIAGKVNIGLFHKNLVPDSIAKQMKKEKGLDIWEGALEEFVHTGLLDGYDYCFMGHVHKVYGIWTFINDYSSYKSHLYYLASLGRPDVSEISDKFLERNIPVVIVEDGKLVRVDNNIFELASRSDSVKEEVVDAQQKTYKEVKRKREFYENEILTDDPLQNIRNSLSTEPTLLLEFDEMIRGVSETRQNKILNKAEGIKWL